MTDERLVAALLAQAEGSYAHEAAVWVLIEHRSWLARRDFLRFVDVAPAFSEKQVLLASVDWDGALRAELPASTSETQMLAVSAELAGVATGRTLQDLLGGLDRANTTLVIRAVLQAMRDQQHPGQGEYLHRRRTQAVATISSVPTSGRPQGDTGQCGYWREGGSVPLASSTNFDRYCPKPFFS